MQVKRIYNQELVEQIVKSLWDVAQEDTSGEAEDFIIDLDNAWAIAMVGEEEVHGIMLSLPKSASVVETHVLIKKEFWGHKDNVQLGIDAVALIFEESKALKQVACIPTTDSQVLRFAQRLGFKREGVNKRSFLRKGKLLDQNYVGLIKT